MIKKLMSRMKISCKEATQLASESFERKLTWRERWKLRYHAGMCIFCKRWGPQVESLEKTMRLLSKRFETGDAPEAGKGLDSAAKDKMKEAIRRQQSS